MGRQRDQERLQALVHAIAAQPGQRAGHFAHTLGISRATVMRDLPALEERGVLLAEDG